MSEKEEGNQPLQYKSYRVDFDYTVTEQASMYVVAPDAEGAKEGCLQLLAETEHGPTAKITKVEIYKRKEQKEQVLN